jgi:hypothetical protein
MIAPKKNPEDVGIFPINVTLKDNNKFPLSATYSFNIIVKEATPVSANTTNSSNT